MFTLEDLKYPVIQAPMAGGPSTADLAAAVSTAGGLGYLAAGYKTCEAMAREVKQIARRSLPFGVNLFVPEADVSDPLELAAYARTLAGIANHLGVEAPVVGPYNDDQYPAKIAWFLGNPVPVVSFTFGLPEPETVSRLRAVGSAVVLSVSNPHEAVRAAALGPDAIVLQGPEAGGHRATLDMREDPDQRTLDELLEQTLSVVKLPVIAAGGIATPERVRQLLDAGATAVQIGTLFLTADEAGTKASHREALLSGTYPATCQTRAFSGRVARGLQNRFIDLCEGSTVAGYPQVHYMTAPLRLAADRNNDPDFLNLWASDAQSRCRAGSAASILTSLLEAEN